MPSNRQLCIFLHTRVYTTTLAALAASAEPTTAAATAAVAAATSAASANAASSFIAALAALTALPADATRPAAFCSGRPNVPGAQRVHE